MQTIIRGGRVVSSQGIQEADVLIADGAVARVGRDLADGADRTIDAEGCLVLPGVIDVHTHPIYLDDLESLPVTAAHGGVTTVIHYAYAKPGSGLVETLRSFREEAERVSVLDFALHGGLFDPENQSGEIPEAVSEGVTSFKMFMTYAELGWMTDDYQLMRTLDLIARAGGLAAVHAENGLATDYLQDRMLAAGTDPREAFLDTRPALLEAEAIHRAIAMAQVAGCPLYIPHMTASLGIDVVADAREKGFRVYAETCPQYLTLTHEDLLAQGPLLKIGPPLREATDRDALWRGLSAGVLDTVASDHAAKAKTRSDDFFDAPYGSPQVETMLPLAYSGGVAEDRIGLERLVRTMCENPARIFGLYPKKGALQPGSDADLVLFDPNERWTIRHAEQHSQAFYSAYEGRSCVGRPVLTMQRGEVLEERGEMRAAPGRAIYHPTCAGRVALSELS